MNEKMNGKMTLDELTKKRNELALQMKMGKLRNIGEWVKIKKEIARKKTKGNGE